MGDEFDSDDNGPIPPHERVWRHPAEVSNENRQRHAQESAPPPVGRRVAALVAFVSIGASAVLLLVTLPKGVPSAESSSTTDGANSFTVVKGGGTNIPSPRTANAIAIAEDVVVMTRDDAATGRATLADGTSFDVTPIDSDPRFGISFMRAETDVTLETNDLTDDEFEYLGRVGNLSLVLSDGSMSSTNLGIATENTTTWWPLSLDTNDETRLNSSVIASIVDSDGKLVGVAVRRNHSTWAAKISDLRERIVSDKVSTTNATTDEMSDAENG